MRLYRFISHVSHALGADMGYTSGKFEGSEALLVKMP